jgi:hypothetical protein
MRSNLPELYDLMLEIYGDPSDICDSNNGVLRDCNSGNNVCSQGNINWGGMGP